jgi:hypothetical protein
VPKGTAPRHRRVAPEQRALRSAKHLRALQIEDRESLQRRVFHDDPVDHERHRLARVEVEVRIAQAADVEAGERASEGGFRLQARCPVADGEHVARRGTYVAQKAVIQRAHRERHLLDVLYAALRRDGDRVECDRIGGTFVCCNGGDTDDRDRDRDCNAGESGARRRAG